MNIEKLIDAVILREGGYSNDPKDPGGETNHGITLVTARAFGYTGPMPDLPQEVAREIYRERYWTQPKFNLIDAMSGLIAEEMLDTGVNMGTGVAAKYLQRALNTLNREATDFPDIEVDGAIGKMSLYCLKSYLDKRGKTGESVLFKLLNDQQGVGYMERAERNKSLERFMTGWVDTRVA